MLGSEVVEGTPYALKRRGEFHKALHSYARYYAEAVEIGDSFIQEQCFEQIFDIVLLKYLREERRFESPPDLRRSTRDDITELLGHIESIEPAAFESHLSKCWQTFSPRGRGKSPFSVDKHWLVPPRKKRRDSSDEP